MLRKAKEERMQMEVICMDDLVPEEQTACDKHGYAKKITDDGRIPVLPYKKTNGK